MNLIFWYRSLMRSVGAMLVKLIATATSGLVSFTTNVIRPVKVTCEFSPVQDLSHGDPSPENECPISGWTGCEIPHTGKNLVGVNTLELGLFNPTTGEAEDSTTVFRSKHKIPVAPGETFTISISGTTPRIWPAIYWWDANGNYINRDLPTAVVTTFTATAPANARWMGFHQSISSRMPSIDAFVNTYDAQWEKGSVRTDYESYQGETIPITFTDPDTEDPLTVYGRTLTLNEDGSADLYSNIYCLVCDGSEDENWRKGDIDNTFYAYEILRGRIYQKPQKTANDHVPLCNEFKWHMIGTYVRANLDELNDNEIAYGKNGYNLNVKTSSYNTLEDFKSFLSENPIVVLGYEAHAKTYHFNNIGQLKSFLGANNIWHNMHGDITVEYWNKQ